MADTDPDAVTWSSVVMVGCFGLMMWALVKMNEKIGELAGRVDKLDTPAPEATDGT